MLVFVIQSYTAVCICHPDNVRIYTVFNTFICNGGVFIFFLEVRDLDNDSRRHTREWKQDFGRGIIIFFLLLIFKGNIFWLP